MHFHTNEVKACHAGRDPARSFLTGFWLSTESQIALCSCRSNQKVFGECIAGNNNKITGGER
jgi:hypothetical protein